MIRYFLSFFILKSFLLGCSLCSIYSPKTHVSTQIKADKESIKSLKVNWSFASEFTKELLQIYDLNLDMTFDEKELKLIETALIDYLEPKNFLTSISYDNKINQESLPFVIKSYKMIFKNSVLNFEYTIDLNYKIYDKNILNIRIFDNEGYFFIIFDPMKHLMHIPYKISKTSSINEVSFVIDAPLLGLQKEKEENSKIDESQKVNLNPEVIQEKRTEALEKEEVNLKKENILDKFTLNIKKYLLDIQKKEDNFALLFLLMASFIYGVIHSIGPGHGKALAFSYFSSFKSSYFEAFIISFATAFVHIIGALIIVLISVVILQSVVNGFMENSIFYLTTFSAIIIMILALYILYKKVRKKSSSCSCNINLKTTTFSTIPASINFVNKTTNKPVLNKLRSKKQDLIFVLSAGIIPCPGTVLLFVYAFLLKTYFAVILASISISLGMAIVIFASSFLGVSTHRISSKSKKLINILEILSPVFMFILALLLLLNANKF